MKLWIIVMKIKTDNRNKLDKNTAFNLLLLQFERNDNFKDLILNNKYKKYN